MRFDCDAVSRREGGSVGGTCDSNRVGCVLLECVSEHVWRASVFVENVTTNL